MVRATMPTTFSELLRGATVQDGALSVDVPDDWRQGRSVFGGLQAALALAAMRTVVDEIPLRTLQVTCVAPVPAGPVKARATILRRGKNATLVEARIVDGAETQAIAVGMFGIARRSGVALLPTQPPLVADRSVRIPYVAGLHPSFTQHFEVTLRRGPLPFSGEAGDENVFDVTLRDPGPTSELHAVAIADFPPPIALARLTPPAQGSTVTWMLETMRDGLADLPLEGWRLDARLEAARDGYTSQTVMVWGPGGVPVASGRQSMLVFG